MIVQHVNAPHEAQNVTIPVPEIASDKPMAATWIRPDAWTGRAVVLCCGAGDHRFAFKRLLFDRFLDRGLAVLTIDPPGHGDYMTVASTVGNSRAATTAAADWLHAQPGFARLGAVGISFGGNQLADLAMRDGRVSALATISTPTKLQLLTRRLYALEGLSLLWPRNFGVLSAISLADVRKEWNSMRGAWYGESLYDMIDAFDTVGAVRAMGRRPTMFLHGSRDVAIPVENVHRIYAAAEPEKELHIEPQATHLTVILHRRAMQRLANWMAEKLA